MAASGLLLLFATAPDAFAQRSLQPDVVATLQYSIGNPSAEEQLCVEYINRARANPTAEGERLASTNDPSVLQAYGLFAVNLVLLRAQLAAIPPQPPLSINPLLLNMARAHTQNMFNLGYQGHGDFDGGPSTIDARITNSGYLEGSLGWSYGENVFAFASSVFHGYAGLEVDWGVGVGGMQVPPAHRNNIHSSDFREIGVGVVLGTNQVGGRPPVGPQLVTQDFGRRSDDAYITGVVYDDRNGNGFYDIGEGIPNVRVDVAGANYFAISSSSGGYSVPVPGDGIQSVTFSGGGVPTAQRIASISNSRNAKVDLVTMAAGNNTRFGNISTRAQVGAGTEVVIGGFIINGTGDKKVVIRAIGPRLGDFGVPNVLQNPTLQIFHGSDPVALNDDWLTSSDTQEIIANGLAPVYPSESALLLRLPAGAYTAVVSGVGNTVGAGLVEVYELEPAATARLQNISTRARVGLDNDVLIGGMIVAGDGTQKVVIRAIGPTLTQFGVAGALANPALRIVNGTGDTIASNNDWQNGTGAAELTTLNFAPANPAEAALVLNLTAGNYTAIVSGEGNTTGVALVEAYKVD